MNFEPVIGIEIHVELKTKSKMFYAGKVSYGDPSNSNLRPHDLAFPGTMPTVNKEAVKKAIRVAHAMKMSIDDELWFSRKNYFYPDSPKGFQITQDDRPIGREGYLDINTNGIIKRIAIERIHLEEDTAKQLHLSSETLLDYNRAGTPLIEIVSKPDMRSGEEAMKYVEAIRQIVTYLDVSNGKMEEGSLRCDINVSIKPYGVEKLGTRVEIKNLNSIANVKSAIDYEVKRQAEVILSGGEVAQETRRYDESKKATSLMRLKSDAVDYKYFTEPNILPIKLSQEFIAEAIASSNELASEKYSRYIKEGLNDYEANQVLMDKELAMYFDRALEFKPKIKTLWNYLIVEVQSYLNRAEIKIIDFKLEPKYLVNFTNLIDQGKINSKQGKTLFEEMVQTLKDPAILVKELGLEQNSDETFIIELVQKIVADNPQAIVDFKNGKDRAIGYLVGQVMKESQGKANPSMAKELVEQTLKNF